MAPIPIMPYQASRWRQVFQASVATRSPSLMPSRSSRWATLSARARICGIGRRVDRPFDRARHDRPLAVVDRGVVDDAMAKQRPVLHQPEHGVSPWVLGFAYRLPARRRRATGEFRARTRRTAAKATRAVSVRMRLARSRPVISALTSFLLFLSGLARLYSLIRFFSLFTARYSLLLFATPMRGWRSADRRPGAASTR